MKAAAVSEDVDLSGIEIHASQIQKDGEEADRYAAAEELVVGALDAESRQIEELLAYDIWFTYTESGEMCIRDRKPSRFGSCTALKDFRHYYD